jgi:predicted Zn-dependent peptidase
MKREYNMITLPNGIRVVHKQITHSRVVHCGFVLDVGSRDEKPEEYGIAHFWEHMAFKGTSDKTSWQIIQKLESVGGELNAYTTKEKVFFYASILKEHSERAFELLTDITFNSIFPEKEITKERSVILEEMAMYEDTPEEAIQDEFEQQIFGKHQLGHYIIGERDTVSTFKKKNFDQFTSRTLDTSKIVFSCIGNLTEEEVTKLAHKYIASVKKSKSSVKRTPFKKYSSSEVFRHKPISQAHCIIGAPAYGQHDTKRIPFFMLNNILGGPGMSALLNMSLREKHGLVYQVESIYNHYIDTGLFGVYFGTDEKNLTKARDLVYKEINLMRTKPLSTAQLHRHKTQLTGQLAMAEENPSGFMQMMGKSMLDTGKIESLDFILKAIDKVTAKQLCEMAEEVMAEDLLSMLTYLPE